MTGGDAENRPEDVSRRLHDLLGRAAFDEAAQLYEEDAVFVEVDGIFQGREAIREAHRRFVAAGLRVLLGDHVTYQVGDLALVQWAWTVETATGDSMEGVSAEVLRRQQDGSWMFVIDNSDGAAMLNHP